MEGVHIASHNGMDRMLFTISDHQMQPLWPSSDTQFASTPGFQSPGHMRNDKADGSFLCIVIPTAMSLHNAIADSSGFGTTDMSLIPRRQSYHRKAYSRKTVKPFPKKIKAPRYMKRKTSFESSRFMPKIQQLAADTLMHKWGTWGIERRK